jgi:uncharacterized protein YkwD
MRYHDDAWRFWLGAGLALALIVAGWSFRGHAPERVRVWFREPGPPPTYVAVPGLHPALYVNHDRWAAYLAPGSVCPGGEDVSAPVTQQEKTMLCLINYARRHAGLRRLRASATLSRSSAYKARDIIRCRQFVHRACGKAANAVAAEAGYAGSVWGENIYLGPDRRGAPRPALDRWLNSPHHRENLLNPIWRAQGIAVVRARRFDYGADASVWVSEFGTAVR